ncbi:MAG: choice-of-anchor D domain-containing protein, partial [Calditrichia bacterium]
IGQQQAAQTDPWLQALVDLSAYTSMPIKVRFRGITGSNFYSDMAIDDVYFTTLAGDPTIMLSTTAIGDTLLLGATSTKMFTITNTTAAPSVLNYQIVENPAVNWLTVTPDTGSITSLNSQDIMVDFDAGVVSAGTHTTTLEISSNDPTMPMLTVAITLEANDAPVIAVNPDTFDVSIPSGSTVTDTLTISNNGAGPLYFSVAPGLPQDENAVKERVAKVDESQISPEVRAAMEKRQTISIPGTDELAQSGSKVFQMPDQIEGEEIFGSTSSSFSGGSRDRGNIFYVTSETTLLEHKLFLDIPASTPIYFFVYEGMAATGSYNKVNEVYFASSGTGQQFYSSGPIAVPLESGHYYYIGASWDLSATYYRGSETVPIPTSFGELVTGIPGNIAGGFPPGPTASHTYDNFSPYYCSITTGAGIDWISVTPDTGVVAPGNSMDLSVTFDPAGLLGGDYFADIVVSSNDPVNPEVRVGAHMQVIGTPVINTYPDPLVIDTTYTGGMGEGMIWVKNDGSDTLRISDVISTNSLFSVDTTMFKLAPFDSMSVIVYFEPLIAGSYTGEIIIMSNDASTPADTTVVNAIGADAPVIT